MTAVQGSRNLSVHKIDLTVWQKSRFVDRNNEDDAEYRGYVSAAYKETTTFNIGRTSDTGTGGVGQEVEDPDGNQVFPDNSGFPPGSRAKYADNSKHRRIMVFIDGYPLGNERVGAFYVKAVNGPETVQITTIKSATDALVVPVHYTQSDSIGDVITLAVTTTRPIASLRWRHNGGPFIDDWEAKTTIRLDNVRKADEGIYECHENGNRPDGVHAIMRLSVRVCPATKHGALCGLNCTTCYNGGVCHEETGNCVCPPGFSGTKCETACGNNNWGAECTLVCSSSADGNCHGQYFCVPDPVGCSCMAGYTGDDCSQDCTQGFYGTDCQHVCHCSHSNCDPARGCTTGSCTSGYTGPQCQVPTTCSPGFFGEICKYKCHCLNNGNCTKETGECDDDVPCEEGWGGPQGGNCQQALPALHNKPTVHVNDQAASFTVTWNAWAQDVDHGNGPVKSYNVHYGKDEFTESLPANDFSMTLENLDRGPTYMIAIGALKVVDGVEVEGKLGSSSTARIKCTEPTSSPTITNVTVTGSDSVEIFWQVTQENDWIGCDTGIQSFTIGYTSDNKNGFMDDVPRDLRTFNYSGLEPCTDYMFTINALNEDHSGPPSDALGARTDNAIPGEINSLTATPTSISILQVTWKEADITSPCQISGYNVSYELIRFDGCEDRNELATSFYTNLTSALIPDLKDYSTYDIRVVAESGTAIGQVSNTTSVTAENVPSGVPVDLQTNTSVKAQLSFSWDQPQCGERRGHIIGYDYKFAEEIEDESATEVISTNCTSATFYNLEHYTKYEFQVRATTSVGSGSYTDVLRVTTAESSPDAAPTNITHDASTIGQIMFTWNPPPIDKRNGEIISYEYEFLEVNKTSDAILREVVEELFVLLEDLTPVTFYEFRVRALTSAGSGPYSEKQSVQTIPGSGGNSSAIVIVSSSVVMIALLVVAVLLFGMILKRRRITRKPEETGLSDSVDVPTSIPSIVNPVCAEVELEDTDAFGETADDDLDQLKPRAVIKPTLSHDVRKPIKVEHFLAHVKSKKSDAPYHELIFDYEALPSNQQGPCDVANKSKNATKNRYTNIIAYDHSRVHLEPLEGDPHSDYINASYIDGYRKSNAYIAAQGPNKVTMHDMWRMIWQENTRTIIMVTKLVEGPKRKCDKYWPDKDKPMKFGDIVVSNIEEEEYDNYTVRSFDIIKDKQDDEKRKVKQFHFTGWPDMKAPEFAAPVLKFLDHVNATNQPDMGPIVVHCSAGVGRTGTFITIDAMLQMANTEGKIDVFNFVKEMRTRRMLMIQTEVQYEFIHDALVEALFCGETTIPAGDMENTWSRISKDRKFIAGQHGALDAMFPKISEETCNGGRHADNVSKNRYPEIIPPDSSRPYLMSASGHGGNNYINASFCNGFGKSNMYLTTQVPLPETAADFWCMIYDYQCLTIVALNDPMEPDKTCGMYCPDEGKMTSGAFTIELKRKKINDHVIERKLRYYKTGNERESCTINHIQYMDWTLGRDLPKSTDSFLQLLDTVDKYRRDCGDKRMAVVCMDGVGRCGLLCALVSVIDKIKEKQEVDVFQAVKRLRVSRFEMLPSLDQYRFCYETARAFLKSFETYANFTP